MNIFPYTYDYSSSEILKGISALSGAILKPVYGFRILSSYPQTLKSVKINSCKNKQMTIYALLDHYFELFRMQNSHNLPGLRPLAPLGKAYCALPDFLVAQWFFSSLHWS